MNPNPNKKSFPEKVEIVEVGPRDGLQNESKWVPKIMYKNESMGNKFIGNIYWWLDEISCVIVERNKLWFSLVVNNYTVHPPIKRSCYKTVTSVNRSVVNSPATHP